MAQVFRFYEFADGEDILLNFSHEDADIEQVSGDIWTYKERPSGPISITFDLSINSAIFESISPETEIDPESSVDYYLKYVCKTSRQTSFIKFEEDNSKQSLTGRIFFKCVIKLNPELYFGAIDFYALIVRNKDFRSYKGFLTSKYSILGESKTKKLYVDPFQKFEGTDMDVQFGKVKKYKALYQLKHSNPPKLILNEDAPDHIKDMFNYSISDGKIKSLIRDALFRPIVVDVWEQFARKAIEQMTPVENSFDEVPNPSELEFPYNRVAEMLAVVCYGGSQETASEALMSDVGNQKKRLDLINEKLPMIVQEKENLMSVYDKTAKNYTWT